jgi:curli production assembly/transport component CsgF
MKRRQALSKNYTKTPLSTHNGRSGAITFRLILLLGLMVSAGQVQSQDFVYQPVNPAFGGSNFNYSWMLSAAQVQNGFQEARENFLSQDPLADFEESINRQILSRISREIIGKQFGEEGLQEGQYTFGNFQVDVRPGDEGIQVNILDTSSGSETIVTVPYF